MMRPGRHGIEITLEGIGFCWADEYTHYEVYYYTHKVYLQSVTVRSSMPQWPRGSQSPASMLTLGKNK